MFVLVQLLQFDFVAVDLHCLPDHFELLEVVEAVDLAAAAAAVAVGFAYELQQDTLAFFFAIQQSQLVISYLFQQQLHRK